MTHLRRGARGVRMKIENGKIIEATRRELYNRWLTDEWDEIMTFPDFLLSMERVGVTITEEENHADG